MKRSKIFYVFCIAIFFAAVSIQAQQGFTGQQIGMPAQQGFTGPVRIFTVSQIQTFPHKANAILTGNIVASLGNERYLFRDSSGEIIIKIKNNRWWGLSVGPNDRIEIGGELKRDRRSGQINYFDAKAVRRI